MASARRALEGDGFDLRYQGHTVEADARSGVNFQGIAVGIKAKGVEVNLSSLPSPAIAENRQSVLKCAGYVLTY